MTDEIALTLAQGESLDATLELALAADAGDPRYDDSVFTCVFVAARDNDDAVLGLSSADAAAAPRIEIAAWDAPDLTLRLRAGAARLLQIAPGDYVGDLIQERPRAGALGVRRQRVAVVALTLVGGTGS